MRSNALLLLAGAGALLLISRQASADTLTADGGSWDATLVPSQYRKLIRDEETYWDMPVNLLARLLYQESRYRPDIISGAVRSSKGAAGIAQFMPQSISGVPLSVALDPLQAIPAAAAMLVRLHDRFGTWAEALAAYNWGEGNLNSFGIASAPAETRNYYTGILADIGVSTTAA